MWGWGGVIIVLVMQRKLDYWSGCIDSTGVYAYVYKEQGFFLVRISDFFFFNPFLSCFEKRKMSKRRNATSSDC